MENIKSRHFFFFYDILYFIAQEDIFTFYIFQMILQFSFYLKSKSKNCKYGTHVHIGCKMRCLSLTCFCEKPVLIERLKKVQLFSFPILTTRSASYERIKKKAQEAMWHGTRKRQDLNFIRIKKREMFWSE